MRSIWYVVLGVVVSFALLHLWHRYFRREPPAVEQVSITFDTLRYGNVEPHSITPPSLSDSLSLYHFTDSVDGLWSADVAGRDVELRSLVLRQTLERRHTTSYSSPKWVFTARSGFSDMSSWVGIGVERNVGRWNFSLGSGYDPIKKAPHIDGSIAFVVWSEY